jgi:DeoR/GlpR family transcriptional regulator of sugar metabolism
MLPREKILTEVRASGKISTKVCVQRLGISRATAKRIFNELVNDGTLTVEGSGCSTHYRLK